MALGEVSPGEAAASDEADLFGLGYSHLDPYLSQFIHAGRFSSHF